MQLHAAYSIKSFLSVSVSLYQPTNLCTLNDYAWHTIIILNRTHCRAIGSLLLHKIHIVSHFSTFYYEMWNSSESMAWPQRALAAYILLLAFWGETFTPTDLPFAQSALYIYSRRARNEMIIGDMVMFERNRECLQAFDLSMENVLGRQASASCMLLFCICCFFSLEMMVCLHSRVSVFFSTCFCIAIQVDSMIFDLKFNETTLFSMHFCFFNEFKS